jgi:hypothetical protein
LHEKEKKKLEKEKIKDSKTNIVIRVRGEEIIQTLLNTDKVLIPIAISPYGRWAHMFQAFIFGILANHKPLKFVHCCSQDSRMYN